MDDYKSGDVRIYSFCIRAGQPRAYADSFYRYKVVFEWIGYPNKGWEPIKWNEDIIRRYLKAIKPWNDDNKWPGPRLNYMKQIEPGVWDFEVIEDFTD